MQASKPFFSNYQNENELDKSYEHLINLTKKSNEQQPGTFGSERIGNIFQPEPNTIRPLTNSSNTQPNIAPSNNENIFGGMFNPSREISNTTLDNSQDYVNSLQQKISNSMGNLNDQNDSNNETSKTKQNKFKLMSSEELREMEKRPSEFKQKADEKFLEMKQYTDQATEISQITSKRLIDSLSKIPDDFSKNKKIVLKVVNLYRKYINKLIKRIGQQIAEKNRDIKHLKLMVQEILNRTAEFLQEMILLHDSSNKDLQHLVYTMTQILQEIRMDNYIIEQHKMLTIENQIVLKDTTDVAQSSRMMIEFFLQWIRFSKDMFFKINQYIKIDEPEANFMSEIKPQINYFQNTNSIMEVMKSSYKIKGICFLYMERVGKDFQKDFQTFITINFAKTLYVFSIHTLVSCGLIIRTIERSPEYNIYKTNGSHIYNHYNYIDWKNSIDFLKNEEIFELWINEINTLKNQYLY